MTGALDLFVWSTQGEEGQCGGLVALMLGAVLKVVQGTSVGSHFGAERTIPESITINIGVVPETKPVKRELRGKKTLNK